MKRLLVTGSRQWDDKDSIRDALYVAFLQLGGQGGEQITLVHGGAKGADRIAAEIWGRESGMPIEEHRAMWEIWGKAAGRNRNLVMVQRGADLCLAFHKDGSPGTAHCIAAAEQAGIPVRIFSEVSKLGQSGDENGSDSDM